jgi:glycosyltransferase involved in cell wall biosynthesis
MSETLRIVLVAPGYPPSTGGVERHVAALAERFVERGHDVTVVTADAGPAQRDAAHEAVHDGVRVRRCRGVAPGGAYHLAPGLPAAVRRASADADCVHVHNYHALPFVMGGLAARAPLVATPHYHGKSASEVRDVLLRLYRPVGGRVLRRAAGTIAVSDWEAGRLRADFGVDARVVPNGIDVDRFRSATPVDRDRPYLLCVGRLERYKGVQHAIRALDDGALDGLDLVVAGEGPHRTALERTARDAGVADRVEFLGYVPDDYLPGWYAGSEALLALSEFEAFGLTVGEALAAGTPCVVRAERALADWAERADCVGVDGVDPATVAGAVAGARGRSVPAEPLPTWDAAAEAALGVYRGALDQSGT